MGSPLSTSGGRCAVPQHARSSSVRTARSRGPWRCWSAAIRGGPPAAPAHHRADKGIALPCEKSIDKIAIIKHIVPPVHRAMILIEASSAW